MSDYAELVLRLENHGAFFTKIAKSHEPIDKEEALEDAAVYKDERRILSASPSSKGQTE